MASPEGAVQTPHQQIRGAVRFRSACIVRGRDPAHAALARLPGVRRAPDPVASQTQSGSPMKTDRKINVLHLRSCRGTGGGPEKTLLFSARAADREHFRLHIAYLKSRNDPEFDLDERARKLGIEDFVLIEEDYKFDVRALKSLLQVLRDREIDILSCHCYKSDLYGLLLSRFHPMKLVATAHGPLATFDHFWSAQNWRVRYLYDQLDLMLLRHFDRVLIVSESMRKAVSRFGVRPDKITWVRNAIDSDHFRRDSGVPFELRDRLSIPRDATVIGAVGRLN